MKKNDYVLFKTSSINIIMQTLQVYKLPSLNKESNIVKHLEKHDVTCSYSIFYKQPQINNGFIISLHQTKDRMSFVNEPRFKGKNFYHVTNPFEHQIIDNKEKYDDITACSKIYFPDSKIDIVSRAFYKLWEILMIFDLIGKSGKIVSAHLAEAPGSFVQSLMFYREKFFDNHEKDEHYTISLDDKDVPSFKKNFKQVYSKVKIYEQDGGNLTSRKSIVGFESFSKEADFITADGGFEWINENFQEQEAYRLIIGEIITALKIQKEGGSFVLKIFETFTDISIKILMILSSVYEHVYIFKPFTSRPSNSERYVVCKNYSKTSKKVIDKLIALLEEMNENHSIGREIAELFTDIEIPFEYRNRLCLMSVNLGNEQFKAINKIVNFVNSNDYYGEQYHRYLDEQKLANEYWVQIFYPIGSSDYDKIKNKLLTFFNSSLSKMDTDYQTFITELEEF